MTSIHGKTVFVYLAMFSLCLVSSPVMVRAAVPGVITYQGSLTTPDGEPQASGAYDMEFKLWGAPSGGAMHWIETHSGANAVVVTNGVFSVNLGSILPFPADLFATSPHLWLEVAADLGGDGFTLTDVYISRVRFTATPYAFHSDNADTLDGLDASDFMNSSSSSYVMVETTDDPSINGLNLLAAYAEARLIRMTPSEVPLAEENRLAVIVPPGQYYLGTGQLEMDTEKVDLVGLTTLSKNQHIFGLSNGAGTGVLRQTANDVKIENLFLELLPNDHELHLGDTLSSGMGDDLDDQDPAAYFPDSDTTGTVVRNCRFRSQVLDDEGNPGSGLAMRVGIEYSGRYEDCSGDYGIVHLDASYNQNNDIWFGFGFKGKASGTFKSCSAFAYSFGAEGEASGTFNDCLTVGCSFGYNGRANGEFKGCSGGIYSFGYQDDTPQIEDVQKEIDFPDPYSGASGRFIDCTGGDSCFGTGGNASGLFINCFGEQYCFGTGGQASGTFINCAASNESFGADGEASGDFTECTGGDGSFGGSDGVASGVFNSCVGGDVSFGADGEASGIFNYCVAGDYSFGASDGSGPPVMKITYDSLASGTFSNCIAGDASFGNGGSASGGKFYFCIGGPDSFTQTGSPTVVNCIEDGSLYSPTPTF